MWGENGRKYPSQSNAFYGVPNARFCLMQFHAASRVRRESVLFIGTPSGTLALSAFTATTVL